MNKEYIQCMLHCSCMLLPLDKREKVTNYIVNVILIDIYGSEECLINLNYNIIIMFDASMTKLLIINFFLFFFIKLYKIKNKKRIYIFRFKLHARLKLINVRFEGEQFNLNLAFDFPRITLRFLWDLLKQTKEGERGRKKNLCWKQTTNHKQSAITKKSIKTYHWLMALRVE